jgi:preprotein translocase subunit SecA
LPLLKKIFGDPNAREIKRVKAVVDRVNTHTDAIAKLSDAKLQLKTAEFKKALETGASIDALLPEAFAVVREAAERVLGMRHFDVQLMGGVVLHDGKIAEMRTGEGKTLVATAPVYVNALSGKGVHVITVNDYLAQLHAGWMGELYSFLGLSVGVIVHDKALLYDPEYSDDSHEDVRLKHLKPVSRKQAYGADITYGTNNEFGFDYLRDNMVQDLEQMVQRDLNYAIVDEVDSILIDEARTPLIISAPAAKSTERYYTFAKIAAGLKAETHYSLDEKQKAASLTDEGIQAIEKALGVENIYEAGRIEDVHLIEQSLKAAALFKRDRDYVVTPDGEIVIVDEFTGRLMPGRRWSEGLHQAVEAKEGLEIQQESQTLATVTFQNLFRLYGKLAGMTGTAATEAEEFSKIYKLEVTTIPTHRPMIRKDLPDRIYKTEQAKFEAVVREVAERHALGQPVLLGTVSIEKNEVLSSMLRAAKIPHEVLNAKNNEAEAGVIARAGQKAAVTLATNIAGRGTDIMLGDGVQDLGGLHVLGTERHESRRIDNQLRGRAGRQGDPGSSQFFVSLDDDLMRIFGSERIASVMNTLRLPDDTPIENSMISRSLESAQKKVEGHNFDIRKHLVEYDDVMNSHREIMYARRRRVLNKADQKQEILDMLRSEFAAIVEGNVDTKTGDVNLAEISTGAERIMSLPGSWASSQDSKLPTDLVDGLMGLAQELYAKREKEFGGESMRMLERLVSLQVIDTAWLNHLETMEHLRDGIGLRGYAQKDPLVEYKSEAYRLFKQLQRAVDAEVATTIFKVSLQQEPIEALPETAITSGAAIAHQGSNIPSSSNSAGSRSEGGNRSARRAAARAAKKLRG